MCGFWALAIVLVDLTPTYTKTSNRLVEYSSKFFVISVLVLVMVLVMVVSSITISRSNISSSNCKFPVDSVFGIVSEC